MKIKSELEREHRIVLVDDDYSIISLCEPLVDKTIWVQPFSGCSALTR